MLKEEESSAAGAGAAVSGCKCATHFSRCQARCTAGQTQRTCAWGAMRGCTPRTGWRSGTSGCGCVMRASVPPPPSPAGPTQRRSVRLAMLKSTPPTCWPVTTAASPSSPSPRATSALARLSAGMSYWRRSRRTMMVARRRRGCCVTKTATRLITLGFCLVGRWMSTWILWSTMIQVVGILRIRGTGDDSPVSRRCSRCLRRGSSVVGGATRVPRDAHTPGPRCWRGRRQWEEEKKMSVLLCLFS